MDTGSKRLIDITLDDLDNFLKERGYKKEQKESKGENAILSLADYSESDLIRGSKELAEYLGVTTVTVQNMKNAGRFDGAFVKTGIRRYTYIRPLIDKVMNEWASKS